jgi:hypothetical protein
LAYCIILGKDIEAGNNLLIDSIHNPKEIIPFKMAPFVYIGTIATHFLVALLVEKVLRSRWQVL